MGPTDLPPEPSSSGRARPSEPPDGNPLHGNPLDGAPGGDLSLVEVVTGIDAALLGQPGNQMLRVCGDPPKVARRALDDHPLSALLGFTAPDDWRALGIHCRGRARRLSPPSTADHDGVARVGAETPVVFTMLIDRAGRGAGILRDGHMITALGYAPEGTIADACRRALGLPTAPAPPDTVKLWLLIWLDRLVDTVAVLGDVKRFATWEAVAALHPAAPGQVSHSRRRPALSTTSHGPSAASIALAEATRQLAEAWPWSLLRADPEVVDTAGPPLPRHISRWMDDGMFARWVLAELPELADLASAVDAILPPLLADAVARTVSAMGLPWPPTAGEGSPT